MATPSVRTLGLTLAYVGVATADTLLAGRTTTSARRLRYLTKPALMPLLNAATRDAHGDDVLVRRGLTTAQAMSWAGDVALLGKGRNAFHGGLGAFAAAHVAYVGTFLARRGKLGETGTAGIKAAAALLAATAPVMSVAAGRQDKELAVPVAGYSTLLAAMFAAGSVLDPELSGPGRRLLQTGTVLFLVSDTLLGAREFLLKDEQPQLDAAVMATYTAGQAFIAIGATHL
ncbi:MAG: lysoplasmalogenase [Nocardioidaceae bacterium]|nr:lysoplasmalogenase [Nocardioidaceae bacterium]NUS52132.1 lysoplasmalogenase [Nocardioidaceae bacterium]